MLFIAYVVGSGVVRVVSFVLIYLNLNVVMIG
jgi:hypothetical protein